MHSACFVNVKQQSSGIIKSSDKFLISLNLNVHTTPVSIETEVLPLNFMRFKSQLVKY